MRFRHVGLVLVGFIVVTAAAADQDDCLLCHQFRGLSRYDADTQRVHVFFVDPDYVHELRGAHARLSCTDCHARDSVAVIPHQNVPRVDCTQMCHLSNPSGMERRFSHANVAEMLRRSAHGPEALTKLEFTGGALLGPEQSQCLYCHDEPVFRDAAGVVPVLQTLEKRAFDRCDVCHGEQIPVDVAYYFRHIASRLQPARPTLELAQVCAVCHSDPEVMRTRELPNAVASYLRSFHGKAALLGDQSTANCLSCHVSRGANAHMMLARTDPRSSVFPANAVNSCRTTACHPGAEPRFAAASVHLDLPSTWATLEFAIAAAFILLTIGSFGPSLLLCLLELLQIVIGRHHHLSHAAEGTVQAVLAHPQGRQRLKRFTVSQRYQHWVLVILFVTLATTGFPMKFADREWARHVIDAFGGLHVARTFHHWAGLALILGFAVHMVYALRRLVQLAAERRPAGGRVGFWRAIWRLPMVLEPADAARGGQLLLYLVGLRRDPPTFGRFTVKEKFEYIGVFWGTTLLGITGALLWGEAFFSRFITGRILNIALIAHTYEAFLAIIHVGILHIVNVMFSPNVFPLSLATITGDTPTVELADAHREFVDQAARDLHVTASPSGDHA